MPKDKTEIIEEWCNKYGRDISESAVSIDANPSTNLIESMRYSDGSLYDITIDTSYLEVAPLNEGQMIINQDDLINLYNEIEANCNKSKSIDREFTVTELRDVLKYSLQNTAILNVRYSDNIETINKNALIDNIILKLVNLPERES